MTTTITVFDKDLKAILRTTGLTVPEVLRRLPSVSWTPAWMRVVTDTERALYKIEGSACSLVESEQR